MNGIPCSRHSFIAFGVADDGMDAVAADYCWQWLAPLISVN